MQKIDAYANITPQKYIDAFAKKPVSWEIVTLPLPSRKGRGIGNETLFSKII